MGAGQQDLFAGVLTGAFETEDQPESFPFQPRLKEWSYSRREVFEKCQRLYYYQYYGASARTAKEDPLKTQLRFLKSMSSRYLRAGDIMHWAISCSLKARAKGREWSPSFLVEFARKKLKEDIAFSRGYKEATPLPEGGTAPALLMEFYYGLADAEQLYQNVGEKLVQALHAFQTTTEYLPFRAGVDSGYSRIESPILVKVQGVTLRGKVDLAFSQNGRFTVVDWKMGKGEGGDDSLQLLFYALWATQMFECQPRYVDLFKAYLGGGSVCRFDFGAKEIVRAKARIAQDVERMRAVDEYGRNGQVGAFTPCGQERVCAGCVFQGVCPKE